jgi:hypothetical protein
MIHLQASATITCQDARDEATASGEPMPALAMLHDMGVISQRSTIQRTTLDAASCEIIGVVKGQ